MTCLIDCGGIFQIHTYIETDRLISLITWLPLETLKDLHAIAYNISNDDCRLADWISVLVFMTYNGMFLSSSRQIDDTDVIFKIC